MTPTEKRLIEANQFAQQTLRRITESFAELRAGFDACERWDPRAVDPATEQSFRALRADADKLRDELDGLIEEITTRTRGTNERR